MNAIDQSIKEVASKRGEASLWAQRHILAWAFPDDGFERALKDMILGLSAYGDAMRGECGTPPGNDAYLGPAFRHIAQSIVRLLDGKLGRFDGGTLDALVRAICAENGVSLEG